MSEEFRRHLVAAEVFVNRMIVAWLNDNDRFELVQSLIGVRRSLHYTLSFNALALPSESELTAEIALERQDGALRRIWRAKEVGGAGGLKTRPLDLAIDAMDSIETSIRRERALEGTER